MLSEEKKKKVLDFISNYVHKNGFSPSYREIGEAVGIKSPSTVSGYVRVLREEGRLLAKEGHPRSVVVAPRTSAKTGCRRICLETADGGEVSFDFSVKRGRNDRLVCSFGGVLDVSRCKGPVSRVVGYSVEEAGH